MHLKSLFTISVFFLVACSKPPVDACHVPDIDTSSWETVGLDSIATVWDGHLKFKIPNNFKSKTLNSQHGGYSYGTSFSTFDVINGLWGNESFIPFGVDNPNFSKCIVEINEHDVLITTSKSVAKYYVSAWMLGGDQLTYGNTQAYSGESFSRNRQNEFLAIIRSIEFKDYPKIVL